MSKAAELHEATMAERTRGQPLEKEKKAVSISRVPRKGPKRERIWYLFIAPNVLTFLAFNLFTWIYLIYLSFHSWDLIRPRKFVGLGNLRKLLSDPVFAKALVNTCQYVVMFVLPVAAISLALAVLVNRRLRGIYFFRAAYYLPVVTSIAVLSMIWRFMLIPREEGPLNYLLSLIGIPTQEWFVDPKQALPSVTGMQIWATMGYYMILWLAGLQSIPEELYEAARMDGAGSWALFRHVTLPMLKTTNAFILAIATIGAFQMFGPVYILTGGGPIHSTMTLVYYVWQRAFARYHMGYSAAISIVLFVLILIVSLLQRRYVGWGEEMY